MIKKPWQIWTAFSLCLIAVVLAMLWLSFKTIQLDALRETDRVETERARQEAELQERINTALYRMDLLLLPLVSQEASRAFYVYESFVDSELVPFRELELRFSGAETDPRYELGKYTSPLMFETPQFVRLHFQVREGDEFSSPQVPREKDRVFATELFFVSKTSIEEHEERLNAVKQFCSYDALQTCCGSSVNDTSQVVQNDVQILQSTNAYEVPAIDKILEQIKVKGSEDKSGQSKANYRQSAGKLAIQQTRGQERVNEDFNRRRDSTRNFASQQAFNNNALGQGGMGQSWQSNQGGRGGGFGGEPQQAAPFPTGSPVSSPIRQGVMQPTWIGDNLLLTRSIEDKTGKYYQCCWLDWEAIVKSLRDEVTDILPAVDFEPIEIDTDLDLGTALTTIPVQLVVDDSGIRTALSLDSTDGQQESGLRMALWLAWGGLGLATIASIGLLHGVMKLSERRAAFVSAVTHELRTPLTTFRMYAEMLAEKMVPPERQSEYTNTLRVQADRLSHLVENVLQFARLEKHPAKQSQETVAVSTLLDRFSSRLQERAFEADMKLEIQLDETVQDLEFATQPSNVEQVLFNLVDNACKYGRPSENDLIELNVKTNGQSIQFLVRDHGPGIAGKTKRLMFRPFHKSDLDAANSAPGVGLGLALCKRMAASLGGRLFHQDCDDGACFVLELPA